MFALELFFIFLGSFLFTHGVLQSRIGQVSIGIGLFIAAFLTAALR